MANVWIYNSPLFPTLQSGTQPAQSHLTPQSVEGRRLRLRGNDGAAVELGVAACVVLLEAAHLRLADGELVIAARVAIEGAAVPAVPAVLYHPAGHL